MNQKNIKQEITRYFFLHPTQKLRVRQIERIVKVPLPSVIRYTNELEKENILQISTIVNIKTFCANRNSKRYLLEKKLFNLKELYNCNLIDFIIKELSNPTIILFGSYSKGEDIESSDIDIFIETSNKKELKFEKFEKPLQRKIQIFAHKSINEIKNKELKNNIVNGILLNGFLEVF